MKFKIIQKIVESGLVAVVRAESPDVALKAANACAEGGIQAIEITFTVPGALRVLEDLATRFSGGPVLVGAGTVLDSETARAAILAGARFVVSPSLSAGAARLCHRYQIPYLPGCSTVREIVKALEAGADIIKIFPSETLGPDFIKAVLGPIPNAPLMPTGGVNLENAGNWIRAGCVAVGVGGNLTRGAQHGDFASIATLARQYLNRVREARADKRGEQ